MPPSWATIVGIAVPMTKMSRAVRKVQTISAARSRRRPPSIGVAKAGLLAVVVGRKDQVFTGVDAPEKRAVLTLGALDRRRRDARDEEASLAGTGRVRDVEDADAVAVPRGVQA